MKKKDRYINYILTLAFIFLIVLFLVSIVLISRVVFSDDTSIGAHLQETQDLIKDANEVKNSNQTFENHIDSIIYSDYINNSLINETAIFDLNNNRSILTYVFDSKINKENGYIYLDIKNLSNINNKEIILFKYENKYELGLILEYDPKTQIANMKDLKKHQILDISKENILGKLMPSIIRNN